MEKVEDFKYFGSYTNSQHDIQCRKAQAWAAVHALDKVWRAPIFRTDFQYDGWTDPDMWMRFMVANTNSRKYWVTPTQECCRKLKISRGAITPAKNYIAPSHGSPPSRDNGVFVWRVTWCVMTKYSTKSCCGSPMALGEEVDQQQLCKTFIFSLKKDSRTRGHEAALVKDQCTLSLDDIRNLSTRFHRGQWINGTNYLQIV